MGVIVDAVHLLIDETINNIHCFAVSSHSALPSLMWWFSFSHSG